MRHVYIMYALFFVLGTFFGQRLLAMLKGRTS